jgi:hypothetical protein
MKDVENLESIDRWNRGRIIATAYYPDLQANARLIAAAPELYDALITLEQAYSNKHSPQHRAACLAQARAALRKVQP